MLPRGLVAVTILFLSCTSITTSAQLTISGLGPMLTGGNVVEVHHSESATEIELAAGDIIRLTPSFERWWPRERVETVRVIQTFQPDSPARFMDISTKNGVAITYGFGMTTKHPTLSGLIFDFPPSDCGQQRVAVRIRNNQGRQWLLKAGADLQIENGNEKWLLHLWRIRPASPDNPGVADSSPWTMDVSAVRL